MARLRAGLHSRARRTRDAILELSIGPTISAVGYEWTLEELAVAWEAERDGLMAAKRLPGTRPWGYWRFELHEEWPQESRDETLRLAELGELTPGELAAFEEDANVARMRIGSMREVLSGSPDETFEWRTGSYPDTREREGLRSLDVDACELWDAIRAIRRAS